MFAVHSANFEVALFNDDVASASSVYSHIILHLPIDFRLAQKEMMDVIQISFEGI